MRTARFLPTQSKEWKFKYSGDFLWWVGAERPPTTKKIWFYFVAIPKQRHISLC